MPTNDLGLRRWRQSIDEGEPVMESDDADRATAVPTQKWTLHQVLHSMSGKFRYVVTPFGTEPEINDAEYIETTAGLEDVLNGADVEIQFVSADAYQPLREALERIERWFGEFPDTGRMWDDGSPMSYVACYGTDGERDYMRAIARAALSLTGANADRD